MTKLTDILLQSWYVLGEMSPYLLLGFAVAGVLSVVVSKSWIERHLGGRGFKPVFKATLFGIPLPLCSCGVIPVAASLRQHGGSRGATSAFLLATPQTGVDSIFATFGLLGPVFAIIRPIIALITGIVGGLFVSREPESRTEQTYTETVTNATSTGCCETNNNQSPAPISLAQRAKAALRYAAFTLPRDIAKPLIIGVLVAGALTTLLDENALKPWLGHAVLGLIAMMVIGVPLYVCATGSIPLALAFMHLGATPGAALVFLITGPATNAATLSVTWKLLGKRAAIICMTTAAVIALAAGFALDAMMGVNEMAIPVTTHVHGDVTNWTIHAWAGVLLALLVIAMILPRLKTSPNDAAEGQQADGAETIHLAIEGMRCSHCSDSAQRALAESAGVESATVNLDAGTADVQGKAMEASSMIQALEQLGYHATVAE